MCGHSETGTITTSTGKHDHCQCQHELVYCQVCNVVYCTKCNREWHQGQCQHTHLPFTGYRAGAITECGGSTTTTYNDKNTTYWGQPIITC